MLMDALSLFLRRLISDRGAVSSLQSPRAQDVTGVATSLSGTSIAVCSVEVGRVFASGCLQAISAAQGGFLRFGPLVLTGDGLPPRPHQHGHWLSGFLLFTRLTLGF